MADYKQVEQALADGVEPVALCASCPWDRYCISPPEMTRADVDAEMARAKQQDEDSRLKALAEGRDAPLPMGVLITSIAFGGKQHSATCCPVFVVRLRSSDGRVIVDGIKDAMREWDDNAVVT